MDAFLTPTVAPSISSIPHPSCSLCPESVGKTLFNFDKKIPIPEIPDGTCGSIASFMLNGCFDEFHCLALTSLIEDICCTQSILSNEEVNTSNTNNTTVTNQSPTFVEKNESSEDEDKCKGIDYKENFKTALPGGADDGYCAEYASPMATAFAIMQYSEPTEDFILCMENVFGSCFVSIDETMCNSCEIGKGNICDDGNYGFKVDCTNVNSAFKDISVCANRVFFVKEINYSGGYEYSSGGDSGGRSTINDIDPARITIIIFIFAVIILLHMSKALTLPRNTSGYRRTDAVIVELPSVRTASRVAEVAPVVRTDAVIVESSSVRTASRVAEVAPVVGEIV